MIETDGTTRGRRARVATRMVAAASAVVLLGVRSRHELRGLGGL